MKKGYVLIAAVIFLFIAVVGYSSMDFSGQGYNDVSPEKAYGMMQEGDPYVLDVRTVGEYRDGHIPETDEVIPVEDPNELETEYRRVPEDRDVIVYCRTGRRSAIAAEFLAEKGYDRVYNVEGGITRWRSENLPVTGGTGLASPPARTPIPAS